MNIEDKNQWKVREDGSIDNEGATYYIPACRLGENWIAHLSEKRWVDMNKFIPAYIEACIRAGVTTVRISHYDD